MSKHKLSEEKWFEQPTYYDEIRFKGYTRRDFMKFASMMAAFIGLESSAIGQVAKSDGNQTQATGHLAALSGMYLLQRKFYPFFPLYRSRYFIDKISLDYSETLMAASGTRQKQP